MIALSIHHWTTNMQNAHPIVQQIKTLDRAAFLLWGTDHFLTCADGVTFNTRGLVKHKGYVKITLNGNDLYDIKIFKIRKFEVKMTVEYTDIFVENIVELIHAVVL